MVGDAAFRRPFPTPDEPLEARANAPTGVCGREGARSAFGFSVGVAVSEPRAAGFVAPAIRLGPFIPVDASRVAPRVPVC